MVETVRLPDPDRCKAVVYKRDTYRRTGRGKSGFELHYSRCQCSRKPTIKGLCGQHARMAGLAQGGETTR